MSVEQHSVHSIDHVTIAPFNISLANIYSSLHYNTFYIECMPFIPSDKHILEKQEDKQTHKKNTTTEPASPKSLFL